MTTPDTNSANDAGAATSKNPALGNARKAKQDEFYTRLEDISNELKHFKAQLRGRTILCNCDDPFESNFFKYFALNFSTLGLNKLIATSYRPSPIAGRQLPLIGKEPYALEINDVPDANSDGAIDLSDVEFLLRHDANMLHSLHTSQKLQNAVTAPSSAVPIGASTAG